MGSVGLKFQTYSYYDPASHGVDFDNMASDLKAAKKGDVVLLHGCCHNPSGADLTLAQWGKSPTWQKLRASRFLLILRIRGWARI